MICLSGIVMGAVLATGIGSTGAGMDDGSTYTKQVQTWRQHRLERLTAPTGWLSLVGLDWLKEGVNSLGSAKDNSTVLANAPAHLGRITLKNGKAKIALTSADATVDGAMKTDAELLDDSHEKPTTIAFISVSFYLVQRGDRFCLRIKDSDAETRTHFHGIDYFDIETSWRIEAKWEAYDPPHEVEEPNILGQMDKV